MTHDPEPPAEVGNLLDAPDLASALESEQFRRFLDQIPVAIAVSSLTGTERVIYANPEFEQLVGISAGRLEGGGWADLPGTNSDEGGPKLGEAVVSGNDAVGNFRLPGPNDATVQIDAFSNVIEDDDNSPVFRLVALVPFGERAQQEREALEDRVRQKDTLLRELQHRVRNNLQMITALIRMEERNAPIKDPSAPFNRLAGRVEALQVLYSSLTEESLDDEIDLGVYLSQIASAVMRANATDGVRLDMKVDSFRVSVNVAMPTGLVVNELLTNALKHAFQEGNGGTITLHCLNDDHGSRVVVADDGAGLPEGFEWPKRGKLAALIVQSLRENARATLNVDSNPGRGTRVTIILRDNAALT